MNMCWFQLHDQSLDASSGSFYQLLAQPPSPAMFHYSPPPGCSAEFSPRPASQPMQTSTCYYSSSPQPPSSPCLYGSPIIRHVPAEPPLQFNMGGSSQQSKIPDIVLTGNILQFKHFTCDLYKTQDNRHSHKDFL